MSWPEFYFARHGQTEWNRERRYQGSRDIPLNELGQRQAEANGVMLRQLLEQHGRKPDEFGWYYSPLSRAAETMERMRAAFNVTLPEAKFDARLREVSFGVLEGELHADLTKDSMPTPGERTADFWDFRPREGENYQDVADRLNDFAQSLEGPAIIVAHGGVMRVMRHIVEGMSKLEAVNWPPTQGAIAHFKVGEMQLFETDLAGV